jgi:hypothetical protein
MMVPYTHQNLWLYYNKRIVVLDRTSVYLSIQKKSTAESIMSDNNNNNNNNNYYYCYCITVSVDDALLFLTALIT